MAHAGRHHRGPIAPRADWRSYAETRYVPCTCPAYQWPHRPGGGLCEWPNAPRWRCLTPASTHDWPRLRGGLAAFKVLARYYARERRRAARPAARGG